MKTLKFIISLLRIFVLSSITDQTFIDEFFGGFCVGSLFSFFLRCVFSLFLLTPPLLLKCLCSDRKVSGHERSCIYFIELQILSFSTIFLLDFGTASTLWYFFFFFFYFHSFCVLCLMLPVSFGYNWCCPFSFLSRLVIKCKKISLIQKNEYNRKQYSNYIQITSQELF